MSEKQVTKKGNQTMSNQANKSTTVEVTCAASPVVCVPCWITIYTATGARHPVMATIEEKLPTGWRDLGLHLVNNWPIPTLPIFGGGYRFTFDCPAPAQYWEINIQTPKYSPFPDYLDSMIGSCENRSFSIASPGIITRVNPRLQSEAEVFANYVSKPATARGSNATA